MRFAAAVLIVSLCHGLSVPPRVQRAPGRPGLMLASPVVRGAPGPPGWPRRRREAALRAGAGDDGKAPSLPPRVERVLDSVTGFFPLYVLLGAVVGGLRPSVFAGFSQFTTASLAFTMLAMGLGLQAKDFRRVGSAPGAVGTGVVCQYGFMPLAAFLAQHLFRLESDALRAGVILVGCCPGGTASNLVTLIARGDVALSVMMTSVSTILAAVLTPVLAKGLISKALSTGGTAGAGALAVSGKALLASTAQVVLGPVLLGLAIRSAAPRAAAGVAAVAPPLCVLLVALICGSVVAQNAATMGLPPAALVGAVLCMHAFGFLLGYATPRFLCRLPENASRTVSIETGMQNSALASVLAAAAIDHPAAALPGAISATAHSVMGSFLAAYWRRQDRRTGK